MKELAIVIVCAIVCILCVADGAIFSLYIGTH